MQVVHPVCAGIDIHKDIAVVCLRRDEGSGRVSKVTESFGTTTPELLRMLDWLTEWKCSTVAMESTGVYWKPVYNLLAGTIDVTIGNARQMKRPGSGKKTDKTDADWIAELHAHGLVPPSFIPDGETRALRDLTRLRVSLVQQRAQSKNRVHKILEDCNIKLGSVVTDLFGVSGQAMLRALVAGETDPEELANLAKGRARKKLSALQPALMGQFTRHHATLVQIELNIITTLNAQVAVVDAEVEALMGPRGPHEGLLMSIPGVDKGAARQILAEIGPDVSRFGSARRLASWAGLCPGNNESAGKRRATRTKRGNRYLRRVTVQCAWATARTETFLGRTLRRLKAKIGGKKAAMAVAHKIIVLVYELLRNGVHYDEGRYLHLGQRLETRWRNQAVKTLEKLGFQVHLRPAA